MNYVPRVYIRAWVSKARPVRSSAGRLLPYVVKGFDVKLSILEYYVVSSGK